MKILTLIHRLPCPLDRGAKLRSAAELHWLTSRHEVWCAGFLDPLEAGQSLAARDAALRQWQERCQALFAVPLVGWQASARSMLSLAAGKTATEGYFSSRRLTRQVLKWAEQVHFDAVLACSSSMAPLALAVTARRRVLDMVDLDSRKWLDSVERASWPMNWVYAIEGRRLAALEAQWIDAFDASVFCTPREVELISDARLRRKAHVIETGAACVVDPASTDDAHAVETSPLPESPIAGFLGAMDYPPNVDAVVWFANEIWPRIRAKLPTAEFWIIGRSPAHAVRDLGSRPGIRVTGTVPEVESYLRRLRVSVAPLRIARGLQTKVLMAMAKARPCVVTSCVSEGLEAEPGEALWVADEAQGFADAVLTLLTDHGAATRLGETGAAFVRRRYRPATDLQHLEDRLAGREPSTAEIPAATVPSPVEECALAGSAAYG